MSNNPKIVGFGKQRSCPSSETMLSYSRASLYLPSRRAVTLHLESCDFCNAELQLLTKHPPTDERYEAVQVPSAVRLLAEEVFENAILKRSTAA